MQEKRTNVEVSMTPAQVFPSVKISSYNLGGWQRGRGGYICSLFAWLAIVGWPCCTQTLPPPSSLEDLLPVRCAILPSAPSPEQLVR